MKNSISFAILLTFSICLVITTAGGVMAETVTASLDITGGPFTVTLYGDEGGGWLVSDTTDPTGSLQVEFNISLNPSTLEATVNTFNITDSHWQTTDMTWGDNTWQAQTEDIGGKLISTVASTVTDGSFQVSDFKILVNEGSYSDTDELNIDFSEYSMEFSPQADQGTITVTLIENNGSTAEYNISLSLPITYDSSEDGLTISGIGTASGVCTVDIPEPATLVLLGMSVFCLAFHAWRRKR